MSGDLNCLAQALDNTSASPVYVGGKEISEYEIEQRQQAYERANTISQNGQLVFEEGNVLLWTCPEEFLIQVPMVERDIAGRVSPISCCGYWEDSDADDMAETVIRELEAFCRQIRRVLADGADETVREAFKSATKKKNAWTVSRKAVLLALIAAVMAGATIWIIQAYQ